MEDDGEVRRSKSVPTLNSIMVARLNSVER